MKKLYLLLPLYFIFIYPSCNAEKETTGTEEPATDTETVWLQMEPVQCLGNPWEKDWLSKEGRKYEDYPVGKLTVIEPQEKEIIKSYYADQGVNILELDSEKFPDDVMVCEACTCPVGYTLYIKVAKETAGRLIEMGYQQSERQ